MTIPPSGGCTTIILYYILCQNLRLSRLAETLAMYVCMTVKLSKRPFVPDMIIKSRSPGTLEASSTVLPPLAPAAAAEAVVPMTVKASTRLAPLPTLACELVRGAYA